MKRYTLYCTPDQTKKALELGAPIIKIPTGGRENVPCYFTKQPNEEGWYECDAYYIPTAEQMICWLEEQGMFIEINIHTPDRIIADWKKSIYTFCVVDKFMVIHKHGGYNDTKHYPSRKEVTIASIDAALEYLSKNKK